MGCTLWTYLVLPAGEVARYPQTRLSKFSNGEIPPGFDVGGAARFVELFVKTRGGHPLQLEQTWFIRYELEPNGFRSQEHKWRALHDAVHGVVARCLASTHDTVIGMEPFLARRRWRQEHTWRPAPRDLNVIAAAVNYDAAKELVRTDGRNLQPA